MTYPNIHTGIFISRPNRFIAHVEIDGKLHICHVKNTGRCKELLVPGCTVYLNHSTNPKRTTQYDLVAVQKNNTLINMDSYAPNIAFGEYLRSGQFIPNITHIKAESTYGNSRFDFYVETPTHKAFIEVKGVTLEAGGVAMFPDAPTVRGIKHLNELAACMEGGYQAHVVFVIQMQGITHFTPNYITHQAFGKALERAVAQGVQAHAFDCAVTPSTMAINAPIPIQLGEDL